MKLVGHSRSYRMMMQKISHQCQIYQTVGECLSHKNQKAQNEVQRQATKVELDEMIKAVKKQEAEQVSRKTEQQALIEKKHMEVKWTQSELQVVELKKGLNALMDESRENVEAHQPTLADLEAKM